MRFALELGLTGPIVGLPGGDRPRHAGAPTRDGWASCWSIRRCRPTSHATSWSGRARTALTRTSTTWNVSSSAPTTPLADDYSAFMGARAQVSADLLRSIEHPVTKVMAVAEPPHPTEMALVAADVFAGRAAVTVSHPRFLEFVAARGLEGPRGSLARSSPRRAARRDTRDRRPVERPGDARRGRPRGGHAVGPRAGPAVGSLPGAVAGGRGGRRHHRAAGTGAAPHARRNRRTPGRRGGRRRGAGPARDR